MLFYKPSGCQGAKCFASRASADSIIIADVVFQKPVPWRKLPVDDAVFKRFYQSRAEILCIGSFFYLRFQSIVSIRMGIFTCQFAYNRPTRAVAILIENSLIPISAVSMPKSSVFRFLY